MDKRPDPDQILSQIQREAAGEKRGKLKIFLGYAAGVGKTYAMLDAARRRHEEGHDVVVGYIETHGRVETDALLAGLEIVPRREIVYRDIRFTEMNTDAILARRPQIALVDELAHTNVPGSRHTRRYQDVEELLSSGINVYTTVNIQHLESLNDVVNQVTGVIVHETIPDHILDDAHEIELIDLPIDELLGRLEAGKIYIPAQAEQALRRFFRPGNLTALREMALRRAAERVDEQMRSYMQSHAIPGPWPAGERLLVCVGPSPLSERLVRTTRRLARRLDAEWIAAYVETPNRAQLLEAEEERVAQTLRLAQELGAETVRLSGPSVAETLTTYALSRNVTKLVAGKPLRPRWREWLRGSLIDQILRHSQDMDVYVISDKAEPLPSPPSPLWSGSRQIAWQQYLLGGGLVLLGTFLGVPLRPFINPTNLVMLYLVVVMVTAVWLGRWPAIMASFLSVLAFDVIFVPPYYTFVVADAEYLLTFAGLLAVGLVISSLATRAQEQAQSARRRENQTAALYELSQRLATVSSLADIAQTAVAHINTTLHSPAAIFLADDNRERCRLLASTAVYEQESEGLAVVDWVFRHGQPAGSHTDTLNGVAAYYMPLKTSGSVIGVLSVEVSDDFRHSFASEQRYLLNAIASQTALALEKARLTEEARQTKLLEETEKLQTTLLNSISHDLRTPLASITGALSSILDDANLLSEAAKLDLVQTAWEQSLRLNRLVGNLLDITRLESGALKIRCQPYEVQELVGATLAQMAHRLQGRIVKHNLPNDLPHVAIDLTLMIQALMNLLDNAVKYAPPEAPIEVEAYPEAGDVILAVKDRGPGLPEAELERIFHKFYRLDPGGVGGTGLGLSITQGIVAAHNGRVWAQNRPGGGAAFFMRLPQANPERQAADPEIQMSILKR